MRRGAGVGESHLCVIIWNCCWDFCDLSYTIGMWIINNEKYLQSTQKGIYINIYTYNPTSALTLYSIKEQGIMQFDAANNWSLSSFMNFVYSWLYLYNREELSHRGCPTTVNLLHCGWQPALAMMLLSMHPTKLYSGDCSHGMLTCRVLLYSLIVTVLMNI